MRGQAGPFERRVISPLDETGDFGAFAKRKLNTMTRKARRLLL